MVYVCIHLAIGDNLQKTLYENGPPGTWGVTKYPHKILSAYYRKWPIA